jgi:hypothetical protein
MGYLVQNGNTARPLLFLLIGSTDHVSPVTGLGSAVTVTLSKNGGSFAAPSGAISEVGNGWYKVAASAADASTNGPLLLHAYGTGTDLCDDRFEVVAFNPDTTGTGGLPVVGTGNNNFQSTAGAVAVSGSVTVGGYSSGQDPLTKISGQSATTLTIGAGGSVTFNNTSIAVSGNVTVGGYATGQDPLSKISGQSSTTLTIGAGGSVTFNNTSIANVTTVATVTNGVTVSGNVTVGGYSTGMSPASQVLGTGSQPIVTDSSGHVKAVNSNGATIVAEATSGATVAALAALAAALNTGTASTPAMSASIYTGSFSATVLQYAPGGGSTGGAPTTTEIVAAIDADSTQLQRIASKTDLIQSGLITIASKYIGASPVEIFTGGTVPVPLADPTGDTWPDLVATGATVQLLFSQQYGGLPSATPTLTVTGTVLASRSIVFTLTAAETAQLQPGVNRYICEAWSVPAAGDPVCLAFWTQTVLAGRPLLS